MDFDFNLTDVLNANPDGIVILDGTRSLRKGPQHYSAGMKVDPHQKLVNEVVDLAGEKSAEAQKLLTAVTNSIRFFNSEDRLYLVVDQFTCIGLLKVGYKKLFVRDEIGNMKEIEPLCVLDFYVHENYQREGYGKYLFEFMLDNQNIEPNKIAYDRPSVMFLRFLKKHYGLINYVPQSNNFVVFSNYFVNDKTYKTYIKDPVQLRSGAVHPKSTALKKQAENYEEPLCRYEMPQSSTNSLPSYKEVIKLGQDSTNAKFDPTKAPLHPTGTGFEDQKENNAQNLSEKYDPSKKPNEGSRDSKKVKFSESPQYYEARSKEEYDRKAEIPSSGRPTYNNYDGYQAPAGRNYTDPEIEKNQFEKKFNRTSSNFETKETVEEVFAHPESEGPLTGTGEPTKEKIPVEYDIKKTEQRIKDTEAELLKCQERINKIQLQSEKLSKTSEGFNKSNKFMKQEKHIDSTEKDVTKPDPNSSGYNKRFGYATVYDNKFKSIAKDSKVLEKELTKTGSKLLAQNPNMNTYQHQEMLRSTPFGANTSGSSAYSKMTSSSAYGNFFSKRKF
ncbi:unnamed protein product [Moneuplotes crassus]|uniref:Alpha-tubulin N-acetyltransferase n=1 Tax=Euplotes crassus TaxID=5936 RepID=A0AAD1X6D9_EUPCR|nr:unnamed protein product [Moneuplotes crassus]